MIGERAVENPPTREQGTDRPGRFDNAAAGPSTAEPTDWHRLEKERFAKDLAERLRLWALDDRFRSLVLVADPRTLGLLRAELHKTVVERLAGEIDKDLDPDAGAGDRGRAGGRVTAPWNGGHGGELRLRRDGPRRAVRA